VSDFFFLLLTALGFVLMLKTTKSRFPDRGSQLGAGCKNKEKYGGFVLSGSCLSVLLEQATSAAASNPRIHTHLITQPATHFPVRLPSSTIFTATSLY
jgi:hypothetical protein